VQISHRRSADTLAGALGCIAGCRVVFLPDWLIEVAAGRVWPVTVPGAFGSSETTFL